MEAIFADVTTSVSEFKKNPAAIVRKAGNKPVAVLSHNRPAFYTVPAALFAAMMEQLADHELQQTVTARLGERANAVKVNIDDL